MPKTVIVSGASGGIGFAIARFLQDSGYRVYGLSRSYPKEKYGFTHLLCDITDESQVRSSLKQIVEASDSIDALINCAGMGISGAVENTDPAQIRQMFDVNLFGTFRLTQELIPHLRKHPGSKILQIGSVAGCLPIPFQTYYSATKSAINAYTQGLRMELRPFGIQVGAILPGDTKTGFTAHRQKTNIGTEGPYGDRIRRSVERMERDEQQGKDPETVARTVAKLLRKKTVPVFTAVGFSYRLFLFLNRILPSRFVTWILNQMYGK